MSLILLYNNIAGGLQHFKVLTEQLLGADSISTHVQINFNALDSFNITDVRASAQSKIFSDTFIPSESISKSPLKSLLDTIQGGASLSLRPNKQLVETYTLDDIKTSLIEIFFTDPVNLIDSRVNNLARELTDSGQINDLGAVKHAVKQLSDSISANDVLTWEEANFLYFAETILASDSREMEAIFNRDLSDNAQLQDLKSVHVAKALQESSNILEVQEHQWVAYKSFLESFSLQDALDKTSVIYRTLEDSISQEELQDFTSVYNRQFTETATLSDIISKMSNMGLLDALGISDAKEALIAIQAVESVLTADQFATTSIYSRALAETLLGSDADSKNINKVADDIANLLDSASMRPGVGLGDTLTSSETLDKVSVFKRDYVDTGIISEENAKAIIKDIETTETVIDSTEKLTEVSLEDQSDVNDLISLGFNKVFTDTVHVVDSFSKESIWYKSIDNTVQIKYIIDMAMIRRRSLSGFVWKDAHEGSQKIFGKRRSKKGFSN